MQNASKFSYCVVSDDPSFAFAIATALRLEALRLRFARHETLSLRSTSRGKANILIYTFDNNAMNDPGFADKCVTKIRHDTASVKILIQLQGLANADVDRKNQTIESIARRCGAYVVTTAELMRSGVNRRLTKSGKPNLIGYLAIAHVALRAVQTHVFRNTLRAPNKVEGERRPPNAETALAELTWDEPFLPDSLEGNHSRETIEDFLDGWVIFPSFRGWGRFKLDDPIDWGMEGANWSWQSYFTGLEFIRPALTFWYAHANGRISDNDGAAALLKSRGLDANVLLSRASSVIASFVRANPPTKPANQRAYYQGTICRRVKALLTFLVCCGKATRLGISIDREEFALALQSLSESLEILKSDEVYPKAGNHGVRQDALFIVAGLLMPNDAYAQSLLNLGIDRLKRFQLGRMLSSDGVWQENSYGYHCLIMNVCQMLASDLRRAGLQDAEVLHDALRRMLPHAEALIRPDGFGPLIGDTMPRRYFTIVANAHEELKAAGDTTRREINLKSFVRESETGYFPDGGYFVSHSRRELSAPGSTMIFFATLSSKPKHKQSDDLSVMFAHGAADLLIDGGTYNKEMSGYDPQQRALRSGLAQHVSRGRHRLPAAHEERRQECGPHGTMVR